MNSNGTRASEIKLVEVGNGKLFPCAPAGSVLWSSAPGMVLFRPDGRYAFVPSSFTPELDVVDTQRYEVVARVPQASPFSPNLAVSCDGTEVWFTLKDSGKTQVMSGEPPFRILATLDSGPICNHVTLVDNANGKFAYVTVGGENVVKVYRRGEKPDLVATIPTGDLPHGIWGSGDGTRVYVGLENQDAVMAIDTLANKVLATIPIGQQPQALVYVPQAVPDGDGMANLMPLGADGRPRRLLDEVDFISGVSGGSFTALAYALYGDRLFDEYDRRFLKRDVQRDLIARALSPTQWTRLASGGFGRSELAAEYYDEILFEGATFGDLIAKPTPRAIVTATDVSTGARFGFTQGDFDLICSDLSRVRLSRAAAASSAVPVLLSPMTFNNYAGRCGFTLPDWLGSQTGAPAGQAPARLQDSVRRPFLHVVDGGVADNLGLRAILEGLEALETSDEFRRMTNMQNFRRVVVIVVNAQSGPRTDWDRSEVPPGTIAILLQAAGVPIDRYSYESLEHLRMTVERWKTARELDAMRTRLFGKPEGDTVEIKLYAINISFDSIADATERDYLKGLPTSLVLPPEAVDRLRETAGRLLRESAAHRELVREIGGAPSCRRDMIRSKHLIAMRRDL